MFGILKKSICKTQLQCLSQDLSTYEQNLYVYILTWFLHVHGARDIQLTYIVYVKTKAFEVNYNSSLTSTLTF